MKYFAYGSNMTTSRIEERVGKVKDLGVYKLYNYELNFDKITGDGSGCATISEKKGGVVEGVSYELTEKQMKMLDRFEGVHIGGYERLKVRVRNGQGLLEAVAYIACKESVEKGLRPRKDYLKFVVEGAQEPVHKLSDEYIEFLKSFEN